MVISRILPASALLIVSALLGGCASQQTVAELRADVRTATFVRHGREPLSYKFGVVDGSSFWAKGAEQGGAPIPVPAGAATVAVANLALAAGTQAAKANEASRAPTVPEIMGRLYNRHPMVTDAGNALMPELATGWNVPYDKARVRELPADAKLQNESGQFTAFKPTTDLVLVFSVSDVELTEKPSVGGGLAAAFTAGFNTKDVSTNTFATITAYKADAAVGQYRRVWSGRCGVPVLFMDVSYPFPELMQSPEKARRLWDAITPKLVENCTKFLSAQAG